MWIWSCSTSPITCGECVVAINWHFGECLGEVFDDPPLPTRVKVEFDLVNQNHRFGSGGGIVHGRIGLRQTAGQVQHHRQHSPLAIGEQLNRECGAATVYEKKAAAYALSAQTRIPVAGEKACHRSLECCQRPLGRGPFVTKGLLYPHPSLELTQTKSATLRQRD